MTVSGAGRWGIWLLFLLLAAGVALFSYRYLTGGGMLAPNVMENGFALPWITLHAGGAATALLIGSLQFVPPLRRRYPAVHRWTGRLYVLGCMVGGVSGLVLALGSTAGPLATAGFGMLALLWLAFTARAWQLARARRYAAHRRWMIRSWALTLAAVTLRLYMPMAELLGVPGLEAYRAISFLCWVPNLLLAELYLASRRG